MRIYRWFLIRWIVLILSFGVVSSSLASEELPAQEAIESFKQAIRIKPDYAEAHYGWAWLIWGLVIVVLPWRNIKFLKTRTRI